MNITSKSKTKQKGAVLALFTVAMVVLIAMAGLALDVSHAYIDKTRLQNLVDAAALRGAYTLLHSENDLTAESDALTSFGVDIEAEFGNSLTPEVWFSDSLANWAPYGATGPDSSARYVQVKMTGQNAYNMPAWLTRVLGWNTLPVGVSATAGPIASSSCTLAPLIACGDPDAPCTDPDVTCYGFDRTQYTQSSGGNPPEECYLKGCSGNAESNCNSDNVVAGACGVQSGGAAGSSNGDIGPGNFFTAALGCTGASCLMDTFRADAQNSCEIDKVITEPGNMVGPVRMAYNTKFNEFNGPVNSTDWPPDKVVSETLGGTTMFYDDYVVAPQDNFALTAVDDKRVMNIIIADCTGAGFNGRNTLDVLTIGCFFGTRKIQTGGGNEIVIWGQFVSGRACGGDEISFNQTLDTQKIILYKDPDTGDS